MFLRIDKLQIELPQPGEADPNAAAATQELLGGRFGEMSTLNNYMFQSFNFRGKKKLAPYYHLVASITAEEFGHVELVSNAINMLLAGTVEEEGDPETTPLAAAKDLRNTQHWIVGSGASVVNDSMGKPWTGDNVFSSGNLKLDLLHNFFLECGARTHKMRVYEMTDHPVAREMIGYLLVRGGVHKEAYAKALEDLTGVEMTKMLPVPDISNDKFPEARKFMDKGYHRILYRFSPEDYTELDKIWNGPQVDDGGEREVVDEPPEGGPMPDNPELPTEFAPGVSAEDVAEIARKIGAQ